jgi:hypothetical protein
MFLFVDEEYIRVHKISRESLLSKKLYGRALAGFIRESALGALTNRALVMACMLIYMFQRLFVMRLNEWFLDLKSYIFPCMNILILGKQHVLIVWIEQ